MIRFQTISQGTFDYQPSEYSYKASGPTNTYIVSPYDGIVKSNYSNKCNSGYILIQHLIQDNTYYSQFCNVGKVLVSKNDVVKKGTTIGIILTPSDEITYTLLNENLKKINPTIFFNGFKPQTVKTQPTNPTNNRTTTNQNWVNSFSKSPPKKRKKNDDDNYDDDLNTNKKEKSLADYSLLDLALSPLTLLHKGSEKLGKTLKKSAKGVFDFKTTKNKEDEEEGSLNEEIKRIKKLL